MKSYFHGATLFVDKHWGFLSPGFISIYLFSSVFFLVHGDPLSRCQKCCYTEVLNYDNSFHKCIFSFQSRCLCLRDPTHDVSYGCALWTFGKYSVNSGSFHSPVKRSSTLRVLLLLFCVFIFFLLIAPPFCLSTGRMDVYTTYWTVSEDSRTVLEDSRIYILHSEQYGGDQIYILWRLVCS